MPLWIDPHRTINWTPEEFRSKPPSEQPVFKLRVMTARQYELRKDIIRGDELPDGAFAIKTGTFIYETCRMGCVGYEGPRPQGMPVFALDAEGLCPHTFLDFLHPDIRREMAGAIEKNNKVENSALFAS